MYICRQKNIFMAKKAKKNHFNQKDVPEFGTSRQQVSKLKQFFKKQKTKDPSPNKEEEKTNYTGANITKEES
jgi:hypothetical protein